MYLPSFRLMEGFDNSSLLQNATYPPLTCVPGTEVIETDSSVHRDLIKLFPYPYTPETFPAWETALKVTTYLAAMLVGIVGNILVLLVVGWNKKMRSLTNVYMCNLAAADLVVCCWCMWIHLGTNITDQWPFGTFFCKVAVFIQGWSATASIFFLSVISADRFFAIVFPLRAYFTKARGCVVVMVGVWVLSAVCNLPYLVVYEMRSLEWRDYTEVWCDEYWTRYWYMLDDGTCYTHMPGRSLYITVTVMLFYALPISLMTLTYAVICYKLWTRKPPGESRGNKAVVVTQKGRKRVVVMLICVLGAFVVCWTPLHVTNLWITWHESHQELPGFSYDLKYAVQYIAYLNSTLNPVLYGALNENFRAGFREVIKCRMLRRSRVAPFTVQTAWGTAARVKVSSKVTRNGGDVTQPPPPTEGAGPFSIL